MGIFNNRTLKSLCTPAYLYFVLSVAAVIVSAVHNRMNRRSYSLGKMQWVVPHTALVFVVKAVYIIFWTWMLNMMCKAGYPSIAWILVLMPLIIAVMVVIRCSVVIIPADDDKKMEKENQAQREDQMRGQIV